MVVEPLKLLAAWGTIIIIITSGRQAEVTQFREHQLHGKKCIIACWLDRVRTLVSTVLETLNTTLLGGT